jgi:hypothetical protein
MEKITSSNGKSADAVFSTVFSVNTPTNALLNAGARGLQDMEGLPGSGACLLVQKDSALKEVTGDPVITLPFITALPDAAKAISKEAMRREKDKEGALTAESELSEKQKQSIELANKWSKTAQTIVRDTGTTLAKKGVKTIQDEAAAKESKSYVWVAVLVAGGLAIYAYNAFSA